MSASPLFPDETKLTFDGQITGHKHGDEDIQQYQQNRLLQARLIELSHDAILGGWVSACISRGRS